MKTNRFYLALLFSLLPLGACSTVTVSDYQDNSPELVLADFFSGSMTAHGVVKNRGGRVIRSFNADIQASWDSKGVGTLDEHFVFDDGELQRRVWRLQPSADGSYIATAGDVRGDGRLTHAGNSVFLDYVLSVPFSDGTIDVRVDDRMYLVSPNVLISESRMSKFGVRVGTIILSILRAP